MAIDETVVSDLTLSRGMIVRYWGALRKGGLARLPENGPLPRDLPDRSYLWPHLAYSSNPAAALEAHPIARWLDFERQEFEGMPMPDPLRFLERLGSGKSDKFSYCERERVRQAPNDKLSQALDLIRSVWPLAAAELSDSVLGVAWIESEKGRIKTPKGQVESSSDPKRFGVIHLNAEYFRAVSSFEVATALIHESAHHCLFVETAIDALIPEDFKTPVYSPLRREMRPAIGVLHAVFTTARIGQWARRLLDEAPGEDASREVARISREYIVGYRAALGELERLRFSPRGMKVLQAMQGSVTELESLHG
jgi:hypothetical protein